MSSSDTKLAIEGGSPVRTKYLPYGRQSISDSDIEAVVNSLRSDWITRGPETREFESRLAAFVKRDHAIAFTSATAALHAVMWALGAGPGKKVAVPAITFAATANAARYLGAEVLFVDIDQESLNIDPKKIPAEADIVVAVDYAGNPCKYSEIKHRLKPHQILFADAAHSLGADFDSNVCDIQVFSFHPVKSITSGEGGMVSLNDSQMAERLRQFRNHGIRTEIRPGYSNQDFLGFNYHMTEMQAALGRSQLSRLPDFISRRRKIAQIYDQELQALSEFFDRPSLTSCKGSAWHLYPLRLKLKALSVSRDRFLECLRAENIGAQVHYAPVYWHSYYQELGYKRGICPIAEAEALRELSLPIHPGMKDEDIQDVVFALRKLVEALKN